MIEEWSRQLLRARIEEQKHFVPTVARPFPSYPYGDMAKDVAAVIARSKPAAIIDQKVVEEGWLVPQLLEMAREGGLEVEPLVDLRGRNSRLVVGRQPNVKRIVELHAAGKQTVATKEFHRELGRQLGYPGEAIEDFLRRSGLRKEEDLQEYEERRGAWY